MKREQTMTVNKYKYEYMITIRKHRVKDFIQRADLDDVVLTILSKLVHLDIIHSAYETSVKRYRQLHYHGIVLSPYRVYYKDNCKYNGYQIHWSPIRSMKRSIRYIYKQAYNTYSQEQVFIENYYNNNYGFI